MKKYQGRMKKDGQDKANDKIPLLNRSKGFALIYTLPSSASMLLLTYVGPLTNSQSSNYPFRQLKLKTMVAKAKVFT